MSRWWRAYDEALDDAKLLLLPSDRHRWGWFCLMCLASSNGGTIPDINVVAVKLRTSTVKAAELIASLARAGLIDEGEAGFAPHNWTTRQYRSDVTDPTNAARQKRYRNAHSNADRNAVTAVTESVTVKRPETERQITETEKIPEPSGSGGDGPTQADLEKQLFSRGKQVCGKASGGLIASLLKAKQHDVSLARSVLELAATKHDPREFVAAATRSKTNGHLGTGTEIRGSDAGNRARELAELARQREAEAGFGRPAIAIGSD